MIICFFPPTSVVSANGAKYLQPLAPRKPCSTRTMRILATASIPQSRLPILTAPQQTRFPLPAPRAPVPAPARHRAAWPWPNSANRGFRGLVQLDTIGPGRSHNLKGRLASRPRRGSPSNRLPALPPQVAGAASCLPCLARSIQPGSLHGSWARCLRPASQLRHPQTGASHGP